MPNDWLGPESFPDKLEEIVLALPYEAEYGYQTLLPNIVSPITSK
jgi:hypothetical protein